MRPGTDVVSSIQDLYEYVMDIVKSLNRKRITDDYWKWDTTHRFPFHDERTLIWIWL